MARIKLPSISKNVAEAVKPSAGLVKSITSKLTAKMPKIRPLKGIGSSAASGMVSSGMKALSGMSKKYGGITAGISAKSSAPKLPSVKTKFR